MAAQARRLGSAARLFAVVLAERLAVGIQLTRMVRNVFAYDQAQLMEVLPYMVAVVVLARRVGAGAAGNIGDGQRILRIDDSGALARYVVVGYRG